MREFDAIVVGIGGMGSATAYHLARRGQRVLGLEQFDIPHEFGSSHGSTRIIRMAYPEGAGYVPLLRRAYELWADLETLARERLLIVTGCIDAGALDSATVRGSLETCRQFGLAHEELDARSLHAKFSAYRFPASIAAVLQRDGGFLLPEACIVSYVNAAQALGTEIHTRERVIEWNTSAGGVEVRTDHESYRAHRLVITAGPWASQLCPMLQKLAVPERQVVLWAQPLHPELFQPGVFPVFNLEAPEGRFYGCPAYGVPGFKIGKYHHRHENVDPSNVDREIHREDEAVLREGIRRYFPDADGPALAMKTCMFTNSPDEHFILAAHPDAENVYIAAGFSGHGFKFASVVGEIMTDLALDGGARYADQLGMFRIARFIRQDNSRRGPGQ
jgi:sarcosine oxidase